MDLSNPTPENVSYMIDKITEKLRMVNSAAMNPENFSTLNMMTCTICTKWS